MKQYIIKKTTTKRKIVNYEISDGYSFSPKSKRDMKLKNITILDNDINENVVLSKINKDYNRLIRIIYDITSSDETEDGDIIILLNEVDIFEQLILDKYKNFLSPENLNKIIKELKRLKLEISKFNVTRRFIENARSSRR